MTGGVFATTLNASCGVSNVRPERVMTRALSVVAPAGAVAATGSVTVRAEIDAGFVPVLSALYASVGAKKKRVRSIVSAPAALASYFTESDVFWISEEAAAGVVEVMETDGVSDGCSTFAVASTVRSAGSTAASKRARVRGPMTMESKLNGPASGVPRTGWMDVGKRSSYAETVSVPSVSAGFRT